MNSVEAELVNNKLKVEKVVYANQNNKYRLDQAENKLKNIQDIQDKAEKDRLTHIMTHSRIYDS